MLGCATCDGKRKSARRLASAVAAVGTYATGLTSSLAVVYPNSASRLNACTFSDRSTFDLLIASPRISIVRS